MDSARSNGLLPGPGFYNLYDRPDICAFAFAGAGAQIVSIKAESRAVLGVQTTLCEYGPFVEVHKITGVECECPFAIVVEIEQPLGKLPEIGLISDQLNRRVAQEICTHFPAESAPGASFKRGRLICATAFSIGYALL